MHKITSLTALISFLLLVLNSIVLYITPHGRIAYWADWRFWGLTKTGIRIDMNNRPCWILLLAADLTDLFPTQPIDTPPVGPARIMKSLACSNCGEKTMESRIRLFEGKTLCMPCFGKVEQKI